MLRSSGALCRWFGCLACFMACSSPLMEAGLEPVVGKGFLQGLLEKKYFAKMDSFLISLSCH